QCIYNLAERTVELEVLPAGEDYGMGVIPWSPLGRGLLAGGRRGGGPGVGGLRGGRDPLEPALARPAGGRPRRWGRQGDATSVGHGAGQTRGAPPPGRGLREVLRGDRPATRGGPARGARRQP